VIITDHVNIYHFLTDDSLQAAKKDQQESCR